MCTPPSSGCSDALAPLWRISCTCRAFLKGGGGLNPGERHSRDTRDDGTVTLCTLRAATVLSRDCRADFGRPLTKKAMSHSRDGPGVMAPLRTNTVPLTRVWNTHEDVNGEKLTVKKWWIFGADFFTVYAELFTVYKGHKR